VAGYDGRSLRGVRGKNPRQTGASRCQILGVTNIRRSDDNSATFAPKCDQSEVKDNEFTGAVLQTTVFPTRRYIQVGAVATQAELRRAFARWGLPDRLRVDNGAPWGSDDGLPTELACWLIGLSVPVVANPPYCAQANGVVERFQGVGQQWAEPHTC
jgi:hypothetical protein